MQFAVDILLPFIQYCNRRKLYTCLVSTFLLLFTYYR